MSIAELAEGYNCKYCGKRFDRATRLGGHVRQLHLAKATTTTQMAGDSLRREGELAAQILERWRRSEEPYDIIVALRVHPGFAKDVLDDYEKFSKRCKEYRYVTSSEKQPAEKQNDNPKRGRAVDTNSLKNVLNKTVEEVHRTQLPVPGTLAEEEGSEK